MDTSGYHDPAEATLPNVGVTLHSDADPETSGAPFERGEKLGRYVVLGRLGVGGMGVVLSAYDTTLDRRVALKLLHEHTSNDPENHARLLREAQALAKLSHPHVVSVYDVGELRGRVFISMEFIGGPNLRQWLSLEQRTVANILAVFRGAGKGLLAAHDAGIVHRDFKPDNVLIGADGEAHVTDFGLALEANVPLPDSARGSSSHSASARLTQTGAIMGTPAYMPIEQHAGLPTDHRSDQFSFCVSLFEALHGVRPFAGANAHELCLSIGRSKLPARPSTVPRYIRRALVRGLAPKAEDRFPSMRALLRALAPPTRSSRTWIVAGLGGLALGGALVGLSDPAPVPCASASNRIAKIYGPEARRRIQSSFTATGLPSAKKSFDAATETLDAFARRWASSAESACVATDRGEQSGQMLDLRMLCLDRGLLALSATLEILTAVEPDEVRESARITSGLPDLALCDDLVALPKHAILPNTPEQAAEIETLLPVLERLRALVIADRFEEAQALLEVHTEALDRSTYPLVQTLYLTWHGRLLFDLRDARAPVVLEQAHLLALEHGLDVQASRAATALGSWYTGTNDLAIAFRWYAAAKALAHAAGSDRLEAIAAASSSGAYSQAGRHEEAVAQARLALALTEDDETYEPSARAELLLTLASALRDQGDLDASEEPLREARRLVSQLNEADSVLATIESQLAEIATARSDYDGARVHAEEALRLTELIFGQDSLRHAAALLNTAVALKELGMLDEALQRSTDALAIFEDFPAYPLGRATALVNIASYLRLAGEAAQFRQRVDQLTAQIRKDSLEDTGVHSLMLQLRSALNLADGDIELAREHATEAVEVADALFGDVHPRSADARMALAEVELEAGDPTKARVLVEQALKTDLTNFSDKGRSSFLLARALWEAEGASAADRVRAIDTARSALEHYEKSPANTRALAEVRAWIEAHPGDPAPAPAPAP